MKKLIVLLLMIIGMLAQATNYHVNPAGNDTTGNGSVGTPYRMPSKAASIATTAGDTIIIAAGIYLDNNYCNLADSVSIVGAGKALTIIRTKYVYSDPESVTTASYGYIRAYSSALINGYQSISGIGFDGRDTSYRAIIVYLRGGVSVHDCDFKDFKASATLFYNPAANNNMTEPVVYSSGNKFYNNTTTNCTTYGIALAGHLSLLAQENCEVYNNTMIDLRRTDVGYALISGLSNRKIKVHHNILKRDITYGSYWNFSLEFRFGFGEIEVYNNYSEASLDICNSMKKSTAFGVKVYNNVMGCASSDTIHHYGLQLEGTSEGVTLTNNIYRNVRYGVFFSTNMPDGACSVDSVAIYREVFNNIGYPLTRFTGAAIVMSGSTTYTYIPQYRNVNIYNNTMVGNGYAICGVWLKTKGYYDDFEIKNNIIYNFDTGTPYGPIYVDKNVTQVMTVDSLSITHNVFFQTANSNNPVYLNITPTNLTYSNTVKSNPLFVSTTNFQLQELSPARNAGVDVGFTYSGDAPDIGYSEYDEGIILATVTLNPTDNTTAKSIVLTGTVETTGGGTVTERGLVYNTSINPTTSHTKVANGDSLGTFTTRITVNPATTYYVRAYAINETGTAYSSNVLVTTPFSSYAIKNNRLLKGLNNKTLKIK